MPMFDWLAQTTRLNPNQQLIRTKLISDPYYRLQSAQEIEIAAELGIKIDVNQASVDDWLRLPGISIHQARSLAQLSSNGVQFCCIEDLAAALGLPVQRIIPWQSILSFCYYDAESGLAPQTINPNTASVEQLSQIPAVDLFLARSILQNRLDCGKYSNLADFQCRLGLDSQLISELMYYLRF
ncbi:MAG: ComEA family DNA-binding protein [Symploca sp. SIO3C6]|uniref:ComEA family DNA-binding protein n=1 Tax=Symploca sp. SIO1C4 TaxID=2607765 RepID=A0A6B3NH37_9CYAN|nr:ComEA family DNA-binding protein [Symploca sp. SIO3C6]NER29852.1 ComEA family DNA-binding protein [Symploca sp. SIO1C4]